MKNISRLKLACYTSNVAMSVVANLSPLLFLTFRSLYGISYSLLGLLVLVNFVTQLSVDLIFSFFSHKFNLPKTIKAIPFLTAFGLLLFAAAPLKPSNNKSITEKENLSCFGKIYVKKNFTMRSRNAARSASFPWVVSRCTDSTCPWAPIR